MAESNTAQPRPGARRTRIVIIGASVLLMLVLLYLAVPWLIPGKWIASVLSSRMQELMNRPVQIDSVEFGFGDGLNITGFRMARRQGFGSGALLAAEHVSIPLTSYKLGRPIKLLGYLMGLSVGPFDEIRIQRLQCWIVVDQDGALNIADLNDRGGARLPAKSFDLSQLTVNFIDLRPPAAGELDTGAQRIVLPALQCTLAPATGRVNWRGGADSGVALIGDLTTPRLGANVPLGGGGSIQWRDLDLKNIPRLLIPLEELHSIEGTSNGSLEVEVSPDLQITFAADVDLHHAKLQFAGDRSWAPFEETHLRLAGRWDPQAEFVEISEIKYEAPHALIIEGRERGQAAITIDPGGDRQVAITLAGRTESLSILQDQLAMLGMPGLQDVHTAGPCEFEFDFFKTRREENYRFDLDATPASIEADRRIALPPGEAKHVTVSLARDTNGLWRLRRCELVVHNSNLTLSGDWPIASREQNWMDIIKQWVDTGQGELEFNTSDLAALFQRVPMLSEFLPTVKGQGPVAIRHQFTPRQDGLWVSGQWQVGAAAVLKIGETIHKAAGKELILGYTALWPVDRLGKLDNLNVDLRYGDTRLVTVGDKTDLAITAEVPQSEWDREKLLRGTLEASLSTTVEISNIEDGLALFRRLGDYLRERFPSGHALTGSCRAALDVNGAVIHQKPAVRLHLELDADELAIRLGDTFNSSASSPCKFRIDYLYDGRPPRRYQLAGVTAVLSGGRVCTLSEWSDRSESDEHWPNHEASFEVEFDDLPRLLAHWPGLAKELKPYNISGGGRITLNASRDHTLEHWWGEADLTSTQLPATPGGWLKPAGMPLTFSFEARRESDAQGYHSDIVVIDKMAGMLGSSSLNVTSFSAEIDNLDWNEDLGAASPVAEVGGAPVLRNLELSVHAEAVLDAPWPLSAINTRLDEWVEQYDMSGGISADFNLRYDPDVHRGWTLEGLADATALSMTTGVKGSARPHLAKPGGLATNLELALSSIPSRNEEVGLGLKLAECELRVGELSASVNGQIVWHPGDTVFDVPRSADVVIAVDLPDLSQLAEVWPRLSSADLSGRASAACALVTSQGGWHTDSALLALDDVRLASGSSDISAHGIIQYARGAGHTGFADGRWHTDSLELELGSVRALMSGDGCLADGEDPFELAVRLSEVDRDQIFAALQTAGDDLSELLTKAAAPRSGLEPAAPALSASDIGDTLFGDSGARRLYADAVIEMDAMHWLDPKRRVVHTLDEVVSKLDWRAGDFVWQVRGAYGGGLLQARITGQPDEYDLQYVLTDALPSPDLEKWLRYVFPGLDAAGSIDYSYIPGVPPKAWAAAPEHPADGCSGSAFGELIVRGGTLRGKAAPHWVTRIFPRLNLAAFKFSLMHDWFTVYTDGRVQHQAVFAGRYYYLYASGWENTNGTLKYEIGIDLLGRLDSPYWATTGGGRIPLFDSTSRIGADGELLEETVNYVPLEFVKAIVWGANPIHTAYLALRKRILEEK